MKNLCLALLVFMLWAPSGASADVLFDNYEGVITGGGPYVSGDGGTCTFSTIDFAVQFELQHAQATKFDIESVVFPINRVLGFGCKPNPSGGFVFNLCTDDGGVPGDLIFSQLTSAWWTSAEEKTVLINEPLILDADTIYWVVLFGGSGSLHAWSYAQPYTTGLAATRDGPADEWRDGHLSTGIRILGVPLLPVPTTDTTWGRIKSLYEQ